MILSFAKTVNPFRAQTKFVTRRVWTDRYFATWVKAWGTDRHVHDGWSAGPHRGGKFIQKIRLTQNPYRERLLDMPEADLALEGGLWSTLADFWQLFGDPEQVVTVVRFDYQV